jgi:hypothetical protein
VPLFALNRLVRPHVVGAPIDPDIRQYVRYNQWKAVFDKSGAVKLYDLYAVRGIAEEKDVTSEHPDVVAEIVRLAATRHDRGAFVNLGDL